MGNLFEKNSFFDGEISGSKLIYDGGISKNVFFTIIIPTYNRPELISFAIESAINQINFDSYEILVIDNSSSESPPNKTEDIVLKFSNPQIRYYRNIENIGMFKNWNRAIELANGKWCTFLHDDDCFMPDILCSIYSIIKNNDNITAIKAGQYTHYQRSDLDNPNIGEIASGRYLSMKKWKFRKTDNVFRNSFQTPCGIFFLKENAIKLGGFNYNFYPAADYLFWTNYLLNFDVYHTKTYFWICRIYENESLKTQTKLKLIEQSYLIRNLYSKKLNINSNFFRLFNLYLVKQNLTNIPLKDIKMNKNLIRLNNLQLRHIFFYKMINSFFKLEQRLRRGKWYD